ncbi:MAG: hypothetical protein ACO3MJ_09490, partial [Alphaproteobacteria bacterium]
MIDSSQRYVTTTSRPLLRDTVFYPNQLKYQKYTKHTLFRVFECLVFGAQHCVYNLVKEHSSSVRMSQIRNA